VKLHEKPLNAVDHKPEDQEMLNLDLGYQLFHERLGIGKGIEIIKGEIPHRHDTYGYQFGYIKIPLQFFVEKVQYGVVDSQSNQGDEEKLRKLIEFGFGILGVECPIAIEQVVGYGCRNKTHGVGNVLMYF